MTGGLAIPDSAPAETCPACGSPDRAFEFRSGDWMYAVPGSFALMRCKRCGSIYPDPVPDRIGMSAYYAVDYYSYAPPVRHDLFGRSDLSARLWYACRRGVLRRRYRYEHLGGATLLAETIGRLGPVRRAATFHLGALLHPFVKEGSLLEIGSGSGSYLDLMRALGWPRVVGVEVSDSPVRAMRERLGIEAYVGDVRDVGLASNSFDAVSLSHSLEHLHDPAGALVEIRRITKPDGRIAIVVPNTRSLGTRLLGRHSIGLDVPRHVVNFTPDGLEAVLRRAGLRIESITSGTASAYEFLVMGMARRDGVAHSDFSRPGHRFTLRQRGAARVTAMMERLGCRVGADVGELLYAVARA